MVPALLVVYILGMSLKALDYYAGGPQPVGDGLIRDIMASCCVPNITVKEQLYHMPSLVRFLVVAGIVGAVVFGGLYFMAVFFEPVPKETSTPVPGVKVRR
jgi:hypothetical protein